VIKFANLCKLFVINILFFLTITPASALECTVNASLSGSFTDQWANVPPGRPPSLQMAGNVVKNQFFYVYVLFWNFAVKDGQAAVSFDIKSIRPDGKSYFEQKNIKGLPDKTKYTETKSVYMYPGYFKICLEDGDPDGKYIIQVTARDKFGDGSVTAECAVNLVSAPAQYEALDFTAKKTQDIMTFYYRDPQPQKLIPLFLGFCEVDPEMQKKNRNYSPMNMLMFFYRSFDANRYLLPELAKQAKTLGQPGKDYAIHILYYLNEKDGNLIASIGPEAVALAGSLAKMPNPFSIAKITHPIQEDMLWTTFFATGEFLPIKMLVEAMSDLNVGITPEQYKNLPVKTAEDGKKLVKWSIGAAALWSLTANAKTHQLVFFYCETLFQRDDTDKFIKSCLAKVLTDATKAMAPKVKQQPATKNTQ
jgi:hypothetical protein